MITTIPSHITKENFSKSSVFPLKKHMKSPCGWWLSLPLWKNDGVRQLGWWNSQYMEFPINTTILVGEFPMNHHEFPLWNSQLNGNSQNSVGIPNSYGKKSVRNHHKSPSLFPCSKPPTWGHVSWDIPNIHLGVSRFGLAKELGAMQNLETSTRTVWPSKYLPVN